MKVGSPDAANKLPSHNVTPDAYNIPDILRMLSDKNLQVEYISSLFQVRFPNAVFWNSDIEGVLDALVMKQALSAAELSVFALNTTLSHRDLIMYFQQLGIPIIDPSDTLIVDAKRVKKAKVLGSDSPISRFVRGFRGMLHVKVLGFEMYNRLIRIYKEKSVTESELGFISKECNIGRDLFESYLKKKRIAIIQLSNDIPNNSGAGGIGAGSLSKGVATGVAGLLRG